MADQIRWQCPSGQHPGALGPRRPRKDNIVRYCLPCSTATGKLVQRNAPALDRERTAAAARTAKKAAARRTKSRNEKARAQEATTARYTVDGVDLRSEFKRLIRLRAFGGPQGPLATSPPTFDISRRTVTPRAQLGTAWPWRNRILIATYPGQTREDALETLVHELTHIAAHTHQHGTEFRRMMNAAFTEAYKVTPKGLPGNYNGRYAEALRARNQAS